MLSLEGFLALFDTFEHSAIRLESRRHTDIEGERSELRAFLAGELPEFYDWEPDGWRRMVTRQTDAGKLFRRARVVDEPLTDYNRYMIYCGRRAVLFGEDIRYLRRERANALNLPDHDFWVFDSRISVLLRFTEDGRPLGHDLITDPAIVERHEEWINSGLAAATPSAAYLADDITRAWPPVRLGEAKEIRRH